MFYGWVIVAATFLTQFVMVGIGMYSFGVLQKPMVAELSAGARFGIGFAPTLMFATGAFLAPFVGRALDRGPIRTVMVAGGAFASLGFALLSQVQSLWQLLLVYAGPLGIGMALLGGIANATLISNWFDQKRGVAMGVSQFSISLSGVAAAFVTTALIAGVGWRGTVGIFASVPVLIVAPVVWLLVVDRPERRGLHPDGLPPVEGGEAMAGAEAAARWRTKDALVQPAFWMLSLAIGPLFAVSSSMIYSLYPFATDQGYSGPQAAMIAAFLAWPAALGKLFFGWLADRIQLRATVLICVVTQILGLLSILQAGSFPTLTASAALYGLGYGGIVTLHSLLVAAYWGRWIFGRVIGLMMLATMPFQLLGLPMAGFLYDRTKSYEAAFLFFLGMYGVSLLLFLTMPRPGSSQAS
ncbi:MAG: MFS transporter [Deltaproteobacteria bacterium]|nr:MFS transporter [Deltaproteobacteria bacterium]MBW2500388.1 MFS transporter [Deltaproteobacteria bacterium]